VFFEYIYQLTFLIRGQTGSDYDWEGIFRFKENILELSVLGTGFSSSCGGDWMDGSIGSLTKFDKASCLIVQSGRMV